MPPPQFTGSEAARCGWSGALQTELNNIYKLSNGAQYVANVRAQSGVLKTQLAGGEAQLQENLTDVQWFLIAAYIAACESYGVGVIADLPFGQTFSDYIQHRPPSGTPLELQGWYPLYDNSIYTWGAFKRGYAPQTASQLHADLWGPGGRDLWDISANTKNLCEDDSVYYAADILPGWDPPGSQADPHYATRCAPVIKSAPTVTEYFHRQSYPPTPPTGPLPIYGADSIEKQATPGGPYNVSTGSISTVREFGFGCMRQVLKGNIPQAKSFFTSIVAAWNGVGFSNTHLQYDARSLEFGLICAHRLGSNAIGIPKWTTTMQQQWETTLWNLLDTNTGGIWTNYCVKPVKGGGSSGCYPNPYVTTTTGIASDAKLSGESAPLALLAYGP